MQDHGVLEVHILTRLCTLSVQVDVIFHVVYMCHVNEVLDVADWEVVLHVDVVGCRVEDVVGASHEDKEPLVGPEAHVVVDLDNVYPDVVGVVIDCPLVCEMQDHCAVDAGLDYLDEAVPLDMVYGLGLLGEHGDHVENLWHSLELLGVDSEHQGVACVDRDCMDLVVELLHENLVLGYFVGVHVLVAVGGVLDG